MYNTDWDRNDPASLPLKAGDKIDVIVDRDIWRDRADVRPAQVLDQVAGRLILTQTEPPLSPQWVGRDVEVTFLLHDEPGAPGLRHGYHARLEDMRPHHRLANGQRVTALTISRPHDQPEPTSLRLYYRAAPGPDSGLSLELEGLTGVLLLDLSAGGAMVSLAGQAQIAAGEKRAFRLNNRLGTPIEGPAQVLEAQYSPESDHSFIRLKFLGLALTDERYLQRTVHRLMAQESIRRGEEI